LTLFLIRINYKIEGMEFVDWLHKIRKESEEERKGRNIGGVEWLKEISKEAKEIKAGRVR